MNKKKFFWVFLVLIFLGLAIFWRLKPLIDITKVGFSEAPTATPVAQKPILKFSVIGDPESDLSNLEKSLDRAKKLGSEFVILVGDLTKTGEEKQFKELKDILDRSGLKYYVVPGNHDLYAAKKKTGNPLAYFKNYFGKPYQQLLIERGNLKFNFLLIDNSNEDQGIKEAQMSFIKQNLAPNSLQSGSVITLVFLHIPVWHPTSEYIMGYRNKEVSKQKDELLNIFKEASVSAVFSGHLHKTSFCQWEGIKMYVAGSVNSSRNWQTPRFLEIKILDIRNFIVSEIEL